MNCCTCQNIIEQERLEALPTTKVCSCCAHRGLMQPAKVYGAMIYDHKTAGRIQLLSGEEFADHRRYNPYGRYTGRGSGVHRVSRSTSHI